MGEMTSGPRVKGETKIKWTRWSPKREGPTAVIRVRRERIQSRFAAQADCLTVGALPGIELPGGVPPTYPRGPDPWDVRGS